MFICRLSYEVQRAEDSLVSLMIIVQPMIIVIIGHTNIILFLVALHKKCFILRISLSSKTKSTGNCGFGHIYWRIP